MALYRGNDQPAARRTLADAKSYLDTQLVIDTAW
jgi:hypothetical protein